jgi:hypothetical protein
MAGMMYQTNFKLRAYLLLTVLLRLFFTSRMFQHPKLPGYWLDLSIKPALSNTPPSTILNKAHNFSNVGGIQDTPYKITHAQQYNLTTYFASGISERAIAIIITNPNLGAILPVCESFRAALLPNIHAEQVRLRGCSVHSSEETSLYESQHPLGGGRPR